MAHGYPGRGGRVQRRLRRGSVVVTPPAVSVVVPVWGDGALVAGQVARLGGAIDGHEWVIAAVGPGDELRGLERQGKIRLVECREPSRGAQMNAGAAVARGGLLCFHHADSEMLPGHLDALASVAADEDACWGAFHRRFDNRHRWARGLEGVMRKISPWVGPLFGDQSIFVSAEVFRRVGGFADVLLMEDVEFSRRMRGVGRPVLLDPPMWSSPRRFRRKGGAGTTLLNATLLALFAAGADPRVLHRWYYRGVPEGGRGNKGAPRASDLA